MTNDETYWPGPSWNFTIHLGGFPAYPVDGDLYINQSGLRYICIRGQYNRLSDEEWNELLALNTGATHAIFKTGIGGLMVMSEGDKCTLYTQEYICCRHWKDKRLYLQGVDRTTGKPLVIEALA